MSRQPRKDERKMIHCSTSAAHGSFSGGGNIHPALSNPVVTHHTQQLGPWNEASAIKEMNLNLN